MPPLLWRRLGDEQRQLLLVIESIAIPILECQTAWSNIGYSTGE
jgi:hypothetical protein